MNHSLRSFKFLLSLAAAWLLTGWAGQAHAQIVNTVAFGQAVYTTPSGPGTATITVNYNAGSALDVATVDFSTSIGGTAQDGVDYVGTSGTLTFTNGAFTSSFPVTILSNPSAQSNLTVFLTLSNPSGSALALGTPANAILTIISTNTPQSAIQFSQTAFSVDDTDTEVTVTLVRTGTNGPVTIDFATSDGSAMAGTDYVATNGTATFDVGVLTNTFTIPILPPGLLETNKTVILTLSNPSTGAVLGMPSIAVLNIVPTGPPVIQLSAPAYNVHQHAGSATVTAIRFNDTSEPVSVAYATSDGTAVSGVDFLGTSGILNFAAGQSASSFSFRLTEFKTVQSNKTVNVTLSNPNGAVLGTQTTAVVTIVNDLPQTIVLTNSGVIVTLSLKYAGTMTVDQADPLDLTLSATDSGSVLTVKLKPSSASQDIDSITGDGGARLIDARSCDLTGAGIRLGDVLKELRIHDILNGAEVIAGGLDTQKTKILAHNIDDGAVIDIGSRLATLTAAQFGEGSLFAPSAGSLAFKGDKRNHLTGDFKAQVSLTGPAVETNLATLGSLVAAGSISNVTIDVADGRAGSLKALAMINSSLFVDYLPDDPAAPLGGGTFTPDVTLGSVTITAKTNGFINSFIVAPVIGSVSLGSVVIDNGGVGFGIMAEPATNRVIGSVTVKVPPFTWRAKGATDQSIGDFHVIQ